MKTHKSLGSILLEMYLDIIKPYSVLKKDTLPTNTIDPLFPIDILTVYSIQNSKIRVGKMHDGGYVIHDGFRYDLLIGCGISKDNSFELEFVNRYNVDCYAFDGTIQSLPQPHDRIKFFRKNISDTNNDHATNLSDVIEKYDDIFLKMDIESGEYPWIQSLERE